MSRGVYEGLRVVEFGQYISVPYAGELFANGGATVIKIEPITGDVTRNSNNLGPKHGRLYVTQSRGKQGIPIALGTDAGRDLARELVLSADIVITNMRPGLMRGLGLAYDQLSSEKPGLIYGEISGYGPDSPNADLACVDSIAQAESGMMLSVGGANGSKPIMGEAFLTDYMSGTLLAFALAGALHVRNETGRGQHVSTTLMQASLALQHASANVFYDYDPWKPEFVAKAEAPGSTIERRMAERVSHRPQRPYNYDVYETADGAISVGAVGAMAPKYAEILGLVDTEAADIHEQTEIAMKGWATTELVQRFQEAGIPCGRVRFLEDMVLDPVSEEAGYVYRGEHPVAGPYLMPTAPVKFSDSSFEVGVSWPSLGEHTYQVLGDIGFDAKKIAILVAEGVVLDDKVH